MNRNIIRFLSGLSFLIFFCPFFQMCSDENILKYGKELVLDNTLSKKENDSIKKEFQEKKLTEGRAEYTFNAYRLTDKYIFQDSPTELFNHLDEISTYSLISFPLFIILSILGFIYSLIKKSKSVFFLYIINIFLIFISLLCFIISGILENINQIKIGYYLFFINSILIIYFCKKELKSN